MIRYHCTSSLPKFINMIYIYIHVYDIFSHATLETRCIIQETNLSTNEVQCHLQAVELRGNLPAASHMQVLRCNAGRMMPKQVISMESDMTIHGN